MPARLSTFAVACMILCAGTGLAALGAGFYACATGQPVAAWLAMGLSVFCAIVAASVPIVDRMSCPYSDP